MTGASTLAIRRCGSKLAPTRLYDPTCDGLEWARLALAIYRVGAGINAIDRERDSRPFEPVARRVVKTRGSEFAPAASNGKCRSSRHASSTLPAAGELLRHHRAPRG